MILISYIDHLSLCSNNQNIMTNLYVYYLKLLIILFQMKSLNDSPIGRTNTNTSFTSPTIQPSQDKRKMVSHLQSLLRSEIQRREEAQRQLMDYRRRSLNIQDQFSRLLQKYDNHVALVNGHGSYGQQTWNKLVDEIERFNSDSQRMLAKRCGEIQAIMTRRINEILQRTDCEIKKTKKLSQEQYKSVKEEIKEALKLARDIQMQNERLKKQNKDLMFRVNVLKEQKNLLVGELNQKKLKLKQVMIEMYEESSQSSQSQSRVASPCTSRTSRRKKLSSTIQSPVPIPKFICQPSFKQGKSSFQQHFSKRISNSRDKDHSQILMKTDNHFKLCLQRERRKNAELKSLVARLHSKIKQVANFIDKALNEREGIGSEGKATFFQKLVERVKSMLYVSASGGQAHFFSSVQLSKLIQD